MKQSFSPLEAAIVARRYYIDGQQKSELADALGISRFRVARLLDEARESGIVQIRVHMPTETDVALGEKLAKKFNISRALVVAGATSVPEVTLPLLGEAAARHLESLITPNDVLGISWGKTLDFAIEAITKISAADIVQMVGGLQNDDMEISAVELVRKLSNKTGGKVFPLHAPMFVGTEKLASELRKDAGLKTTVDTFKKISIALVGIGAWSLESSALRSAMTTSDIKEIDRHKPVGDFCASVFDAQGKFLEVGALRKIVAIKANELSQIPNIIAVAGGRNKVQAISGALKTGLITTLITDSTTAGLLLESRK